MLTEFQQHIAANFPVLKERPLLLACSGGLDSMALAHLCVGAGLKIRLAHCNFNLRGSESDGDELFVREWAKTMGVEIEVKSFDTKAHIAKHGGSVQMAARELRYGWFEELLQTGPFEYVLTAHHADDALETFLINLSRGTGLDGLAGIPVQNGRVIRPMLIFSRHQIETYAENNHLKWREDSSNQDTKYLRNRIRHKLAPGLKELHPTFLTNFKTSQSHLQHSKALVENHLGQLKAQLFVKDDKNVRISIGKLKQLQPLDAYLYGLFHAYGFTEWNDLMGLLNANSGKQVFSKTHRFLKDREDLILAKIDNESSGQIFMLEEHMSAMETPIALKIEAVESHQKEGANVIYVDKEKLNYPLLLRNWEKGDYFYPFGMNGKKKLSKFFKDEKIDVISKEKQWLLCSGEAIVWVVGRRMDERFKVEDATRQILKISLLV